LASQGSAKMPRRVFFTVAAIDDGGLWLKTKTALSERGYKRLSRPIHAAAKRDGIVGSVLGFAFGGKFLCIIYDSYL